MRFGTFVFCCCQAEMGKTTLAWNLQIYQVGFCLIWISQVKTPDQASVSRFMGDAKHGVVKDREDKTIWGAFKRG